MLPTDQLLKKVHDSVDRNINDLKEQVKDLTFTLNMRFEMLYTEELYEPKKFGPSDGAQFRSMKEYVLHHLANLSKTITNNGYQTEQTLNQHKEYAETMNNILMEDLFPNLRKLQQADEKRVLSIEDC